MKASALDSVYRSLLLTKFFVKGWGKPDDMRRILAFRKAMSCRVMANSFVNPKVDIQFEKEWVSSGCRMTEGKFLSPGKAHIQELLPPESSNCHFQLVEPLEEKDPRRPICFQFAGTGDHFFWRRRQLMAVPIARERGISSLIIENPYYGIRKPKQQLRSSLRHVIDLFTMGLCLILESLSLYHWCRREGYGPIVFHGISMGGHMATLSSSVIPSPIAIVPCLALSSAAPTFTQGVMANSIPWPLLEQQLQMHRSEIAEFAADILLNSKATHEHQSDKSSLNIPSNQSVRFFSGNRMRSIRSQREEAVNFMTHLMNECTHLDKFTTPIDTSMAISVQAELDAYQPLGGDQYSISGSWPGTETRTIFKNGHVSSYLFRHFVFKQAIYDALDNLVNKYHRSES